MSKHDDDVVGVVVNSTKISPRDAGELRTRLQTEGYTVVWRDVPKASAAGKAVTRLVKDGAAHIVVAGGDGTVRAAGPALAGTSVPLSVLPIGTANLFARAMELPTDVEGLVGALRNGENKVVDAGRCNDLTFAVMAGAGVDAALLEGAEATKERLGVTAYVASAVKEARTRRQFKLRVSVDGIECYKGSAAGVLVANIGTLIGGLDVVPDASPTDGQLDVAIITAVGWKQWASLAAHAVRNDRQTPGLIRIGQGSKVKIRMKSKQRFEVDGGVKGSAKKMDIKVLPAALVVRVPQMVTADA